MIFLKLYSSFSKNFLLESVKRNGTCCEIGVWKGSFSKKILNRTNPKELYLIDPWQYMPKYTKRWYGGKIAKTQEDMDEIYKKVKKDFSKNKNVKIYRQVSKKAVENFKENYFDFIYVDGDHSYKETLSDLRSYYQLLKGGGIIAGDDYYWGIKEGFPVRKAVKKFCEDKSINYKVIGTQFLITKE